MDSYLLDKIDMLIRTGKYDSERLKTMRKYVEEDRELYQTDKKYLEKILMLNDEAAQNQTYENLTQNNTESSSNQQSDNEEAPTPQKIAEHTDLRDEIDELKAKMDKVEDFLASYTRPTKMKKRHAIAGVILLAVGFLMVVGGGGMAIVAMCIGQPLYGTCRSDGGAWIAGVIIFWIGMIPTIYGIKFVASA